MKKIVFLLLVSVFFTNCQKNKKQDEKTVSKVDSVKKESNFEMYKMTELALLMEQMYAYNQQLRSRIIDNDSLGEFPTRFENIHTATMTDPSENDAFFQDQSRIYIETQKEIYNDPTKAKENFNKMVESCLACHAKKCGGPIPRIKKLIIN